MTWNGIMTFGRTSAKMSPEVAKVSQRIMEKLKDVVRQAARAEKPVSRSKLLNELLLPHLKLIETEVNGMIEVSPETKEKLRTFELPVTMVEVVHLAPEVKEICREYWLWVEDHWEIRADWQNHETDEWVTCRHCETEHNWRVLYSTAREYGFEPV